jgi:predicted acetyltransferase
VASLAGFAALVSRLVDQSDPTKPLDAGRVRCPYRWIVEGARVLGRIALRHASSDYVRWAGHIGFGIRPSARRRGLATWTMALMLEEARGLGLGRVLAVCALDNVASVKTIVRYGEVFEGVRETRFGPHGASSRPLAIARGRRSCGTARMTADGSASGTAPVD